MNEAPNAIVANGDAKIYGRRLVPWHVFEELRPDPRYQKVAAKPESLGPLDRRQMCPLDD